MPDVRGRITREVVQSDARSRHQSVIALAHCKYSVFVPTRRLRFLNRTEGSRSTSCVYHGRLSWITIWNREVLMETTTVTPKQTIQQKGRPRASLKSRKAEPR